MESKICSATRLVVARFDAGEDLLLSLKKCAEEHHIQAGWFNMIGALKECAYGLYEAGSYRTIVKKAQHCFEMLPTFGNISLKEGKILIHAHINASDEEDGRSFGGHLMEGSKIFPYAEVFIQECNSTLSRQYDPATRLWRLIP